MEKTKTKKTILKKSKPKYYPRMAIACLVLGLFVLIITGSLFNAILTLFASLAVIILWKVVNERMKKAEAIRKMEEIFPDFIELVGSNLRAGMTIDRALILSSRKEFNPLDKEILTLGKDIMTGKDITLALKDMSGRINSEKIRKTIDLIVSGIRSGGNIAILLEETATSFRERSFVEKKAASNVLMYEIFIFFAIAIGAPILFALSSVLVQVLGSIVASMPISDPSTMKSIPMSITKISVSPAFINWFSLVFLIMIDVLASLIIGIVNKGEEKEGMRYILPIVAVSITTFFIVKKVLMGYFSQLLAR